MPIYEYVCANGHKFDRYLRLADYDRPQECDCGATGQRQICRPFVQVDFPAYQSPTTGKWITSRTQRRQDLKESNCVEYEPSMKEEMLRRHKAEDAALDRKIEDHVEKTIYEMEPRQRDRLAAEMDAGLDVEITRV